MITSEDLSDKDIVSEIKLENAEMEDSISDIDEEIKQNESDHLSIMHAKAALPTLNKFL